MSAAGARGRYDTLGSSGVPAKLDDSYLEPEDSRRFLNARDLPPRAGHIPDDRQPEQPQDNFLEELDELASHLTRLEGEAGNVPAGPGEVRHEPVRVDIVHSSHDDRNAFRCAPGRPHTLWARGDDDVDVAADQLCGEGRQSVELAVRR